MSAVRANGRIALATTAAVAIVFAIVGTAIAGPGAISSKLTASKVKTIAKKQIKRAAPSLSVARASTAAKADAAVVADTAADANRLGGVEPSAFQRKTELLSATVSPAGDGAKIVAGRGATGVQRLVAGVFAVTFDRDISTCTAQATYGSPLTETAVQNARTVAVRGGFPAMPNTPPPPNQIGVVMYNTVGGQADGQGFHLQVLCP